MAHRVEERSRTLTTTGHPIHRDLRVDFGRFSEPIVIEDKVWIGSNVVVPPGVRIGFGAVIGAGSVVRLSSASRPVPTRRTSRSRGPW